MRLRTAISTAILMCLVFAAPAVMLEVVRDNPEPGIAQPIGSDDRTDTCGNLLEQPTEYIVATSVVIAYGFDSGYALAMRDLSIPFEPEVYTLKDIAVRFLEVCSTPGSEDMMIYDAMWVAYEATVIRTNQAAR